MKIKAINSLHFLIKKTYQQKGQKLKIICDWDDVIQSHLPFIAWQLKGEIISFKEFHEQFWLNDYKTHEEFKRKYNVNQEGETKNKYERLKNDPNFYQNSPFLSPASELLTSLQEGLIEKIIFLTACDKVIFPNNDPRKIGIFKDSFDNFPQSQLIFVSYISGFTPNKGEWIKENYPDFDLFIDDRPDTISKVIEIFPDKIYALPDYSYNKLERKNICYLATGVSSLKKENFIQQKVRKEETKTIVAPFQRK